MPGFPETSVERTCRQERGKVRRHYLHRWNIALVWLLCRVLRCGADVNVHWIGLWLCSLQ